MKIIKLTMRRSIAEVRGRPARGSVVVGMGMWMQRLPPSGPTSKSPNPTKAAASTYLVRVRMRRMMLLRPFVFPLLEEVLPIPGQWLRRHQFLFLPLAYFSIASDKNALTKYFDRQSSSTKNHRFLKNSTARLSGCSFNPTKLGFLPRIPFLNLTMELCP